MLIAGCILAAIAAGILIYLAIRLTISFLKKYRQYQTSKVFVATVKDLIDKAPTVSLDDLPDEDSVIIAEYDEESDELIQDPSICDDIDDKVESILSNNGGIVIFD